MVMILLMMNLTLKLKVMKPIKRNRKENLSLLMIGEIRKWELLKPS
jgi:hypothetical protein